MSEDSQQAKTKYSELLPEIPQVYNSVKIKQEKLTPPSSPAPNPTTSSETKLVTVKHEEGSSENILGESVFASLLTPSDNKKSVELTKSSEELLAELFQAFNSAPPSVSLVDDGKTSKKAKKKHKKDKKKKHKKKGRSSSDEDNGVETEKSHKKLKLKKVKKEKKDKVLDGKDIKIEEDKSKKRKLQDPNSTTKHKKRKKEKEEDRKDDLDIDQYEKELLEKENSKSDLKTKSKIVIKSMKNSAVYEENVKQSEEKRKEKERRHDKYGDGNLSESDHSKCSEISLSDEETYERNRSRLYDRDSYYGHRSRDDRYKDRSPRNRSRDRYDSSYYGHGYRGLGSRYDERDRERRRYYININVMRNTNVISIIFQTTVSISI